VISKVFDFGMLLTFHFKHQIVGHYLDYMNLILEWLATSDDYDEYSLEDIKTFEEEIFHPESPDPCYDEALFDKEFFQILDAAYTKHLLRALVSFGLGKALDNIDPDFPLAALQDEDEEDNTENEEENSSEEAPLISWNIAYEAYMTGLCSDLEAWIQKRLPLAMAIDDPARKVSVVHVLEKLIPRIKFLYASKMHTHYLPISFVTSSPPLFSSLFYMDLAKSVADVTNGICLVSCSCSQDSLDH
jgi:hypothetical protein